MGTRSLLVAGGTVVALVCLAPAPRAGAATPPGASRPVVVSGAHAGLACTTCHDTEPRGETTTPVSCTRGGCHADVARTFQSSAHDQRRLQRGHTGPRCQDCHGGHVVVSGDAALASACRSHLDDVCVGCHSAEPGNELAVSTPKPAVRSANAHPRPGDAGPCGSATLSCFTCHGSHTVLPRSNPASPVSRARTVETCGRCHVTEKDRYAESAHARGVAAGDAGAPTCVSCHGGHGVLAPHTDSAPTSAAHVVFTCAECHEDPLIVRTANLPQTTVEGYERTFHGVANAHGIHDVATCVSCHGAHAVLPTSDPRSPVNAINLRHTCGKCHATLTEAMMDSVHHTEGGLGLTGLISKLRVYFPIAGTAVNPFLISGLGALVGFLSGLFGVGGGFLMTPLLIFIGVPAAVAAATDAAQISAGATSGAISHSRLGNVDFKMGLVIVAGGWTGGVLGVQLVRVLRNLGNFDFYLKVVYVLILGFIGITMFIEGIRTLRGRFAAGEPRPSRLTVFFSRLPFQVYFPKSGLRTSVLLPVAAGLAVGILAAFLGVGGGFIMLPTMIYIIGIPTRVAVGTDLFQIVLTSSNVTLQQAITNHTVDVLLAITLFLGSTVGAQFGVLASRRLKGEQIRIFLAAIVIVVMVLLLYQLLAPPTHLIDFARSGGGH